MFCLFRIDFPIYRITIIAFVSIIQQAFLIHKIAGQIIRKTFRTTTQAQAVFLRHGMVFENTSYQSVLAFAQLCVYVFEVVTGIIFPTSPR